jgi:predicted nuclease of predicted toxin-antitoxin system
MALAVYMDVNVPESITAGLRRRNIDVLTSQDDGTRQWSDDRILERTTSLGRILFTQDDDFLTLISRLQQQGLSSTGIVYAHQLSAGIGRLVDELHLVLTCCTADELANRVIYLPLR